MKRIVACFIAILLIIQCAHVGEIRYADAAKKPKLNKSSITLNEGDSKQLKVKGTTKKIKWKSSNKKIAKVSKKGKVTAQKAGEATITAKAGKRKLKCRVTVIKRVSDTTEEVITYNNIKVKSKIKNGKNDKKDFNYMLIYGVDGSGKTIWKYKTSFYVPAQLMGVKYIVKEDSVIVADHYTYIRLNRIDGNILVKKNLGFFIGQVLEVDEEKNLYAVEFWGDELHKIDCNGNVLWIHDFEGDNLYSRKISIINDDVVVTFDTGDMAEEYYDLSVNKETGKSFDEGASDISDVSLSHDEIKDRELYKDILEKYYQALSEVWDTTKLGNNNINYLVNYLDKYFTDIYGYISENTWYRLSGVGYLFEDLNNDGVDELLIYPVDNSGSDNYSSWYKGSVYDVYTIEDGNVIRLVYSGERSRYVICEDKTIIQETSASAIETIYDFYNYKSGDNLTFIDKVFYDGWNDKDSWYYTKENRYDYSNSLSEKEADELIGRHIRKAFNGTSFYEYNISKYRV